MFDRKDLSLLALALLLVPAAAGAAEPTLTQTPIEAHSDDPRTPGEGSVSWIVRNDGGIAVRIVTSGLDPESAYTVWAVLFNYPEFCQTTPCTSADQPQNGGDPKVESATVFADGFLVSDDGVGVIDSGLAVGEALLEPFGAEVHLIVKSHGPADLETVHEQLTTSSGGCPADGCTDQQFAIHLPE